MLLEFFRLPNRDSLTERYKVYYKDAHLVGHIYKNSESKQCEFNPIENRPLSKMMLKELVTVMRNIEIGRDLYFKIGSDLKSA